MVKKGKKLIVCKDNGKFFYLGEKEIPHWYNFEQEKWLFDESEYQKMFNVAADKTMDRLENIHNHLRGVPETISFDYENKKLIKELFDKYPNMEEVKKYIFSFMETAELRNENRISFQPLLLVGSPGC